MKQTSICWGRHSSINGNGFLCFKVGTIGFVLDVMYSSNYCISIFYGMFHSLGKLPEQNNFSCVTHIRNMLNFLYQSLFPTAGKLSASFYSFIFFWCVLPRNCFACVIHFYQLQYFLYSLEHFYNHGLHEILNLSDLSLKYTCDRVLRRWGREQWESRYWTGTLKCRDTLEMRLGNVCRNSKRTCQGVEEMGMEQVRQVLQAVIGMPLYGEIYEQINRMLHWVFLNNMLSVRCLKR